MGTIHDENPLTPGVLLLDDHDDADELAFEVAYLRSLTTQQRFELMFRRSREVAEMLLRRGHRKLFEVSQRS